METLNVIRSSYFEKIKPFIGKKLIKVVTGQSRTGKSYILSQIRDFIKEGNPDANIIYINKESYAFDSIRDYDQLVKYVKKHQKKNIINYLFIDKILEINEFEKALQYFLTDGKTDIYCSSSNALVLSGKLSSIIAGSYINIVVHTLSYREFLAFNQLENTDHAFERYFKQGGVPYLANLPDDESVVYEYLKNLYTAILYKEIIYYQKVRNPFILENLVKYLAQNTGVILTAKGISDYLKTLKMSVTPNMILNYLNYLTNAYFIIRVKRSDITGQRIYETGDKFYFEDMGLRQSITGYRQSDIEKIIENLVFNYFDRRGFRVTTYFDGTKKIDFICERNGERLYVQTAYIIADEKTHQQIFGNLLAIKNNYPKYVVSLDPFTHNTYQGITHLHIRDFLMSDL